MIRLLLLPILLLLALPACQKTETPAAKPTETAQKQLDAGIDTLTGQPKRLPNPWIDKGCELVTDAEVQQLFNIANPNEAVFNARTLKDQAFCLRTWMKPDWKAIDNANEKPGSVYREFKNTLILSVVDYGTAAVANEQMAMAKRTRKDLYNQEVPGVGDAALWSTASNTLLVQKGHLFLNITLEHAETPEGNLAEALQVAALALKKM